MLLTYRCNARCEHCFLSCGPSRNGLVTLDELHKYLEDAAGAPYISHFFLEGGEPFLFPRELLQMVAAIKDRGYYLGLLTNGFWAVSDSAAHAALKPVVEAGLDSLGISTDAWHSSFVPVERAQRAVRIADDLGLDADLMVCAGGPEGADVSGVLKGLQACGTVVHPSEVVCRGRASTSRLCLTGRHDWQSLTTCPVTFGGRSRVHLGPFGQIHLCQGLLIGRDARRESLVEIFADFDPEAHPICAALSEGGPAELARLAMRSGFVPEDSYADGCKLCFEARRHLVARFPELLGPAEMYDEVESGEPAEKGIKSA